jgi:rare lipoprotein A
VIATALLQLVFLEPTRADDVKADECGLASVYSSLSEETASGEDTSAKHLTAAHRSLPFETMVLVENRKTVIRQSSGSPIVALTSAEE